ncbi:YopT-type cysteine protease domain-containing protein [Fluoribacter dumoffii]|uniref:Cysteine protease domain, YopT-type n=1 Tax=Fluoribacter dumoffii TaxID=463 RepID=A0A377G958_9GAMM|nr:YopT-type cysteine protease domain-containing protein [Fluoribacter dumoffii]KTC89804.1 hypothetical protein Ldum_0872 [Fluoribacter dumoffii NY 23]STO20918.1 cysteine protease domain, YopT-type [Fluoribacter dumoffii]
MSIYRAIIELENLKRTIPYYSAKNLFVEKKLKQLRKSFDVSLPDYYHKIYEQLDAEIKSTSQGFYQLKLIKVRNLIFEVINKQKNIQSRTRAFNYKAAQSADKMLQEIHLMGGVLILPIQQSKDIRCGNSQGECSGYITEWALCLINGKNPFGINPQKPPFKPVTLQVRRFFSDANHLAPLTERICSLQDLYGSRLWEGKIAHKFSAQPVWKLSIQGLRFHKNTKEIANKLISLTKQNTKEIFQLSLLGASGHTMGFYKDDNKNYHFLDANKGWFMFHSSKEFKKFLPFYFNKLNYSSRYWSHLINSYSVEGNPRATLPTSIISANIRYTLNKLYTNYIFIVTKKIKEKISKFAAFIVPGTKVEVKSHGEFHLPYNNKILSKDDLELPRRKPSLKAQKNYHNSAGILDISFTQMKRRQNICDDTEQKESHNTCRI